MGWDGRTLPFFYQRTRQGAQSPATHHCVTHSGFDPELTEIHRCLFFDFSEFRYFLESQVCSAEGGTAFKHTWKAIQEHTVVMSQIMPKTTGDRLKK